MSIFKDYGIVLVFISGSIIGSFLNVCIHRIPLKESVIFPGSYCPNCKKHIKWYDNIPILSYIFLGGKCGSCRIRIPLRYPAVEILTALATTFLYSRFGLDAETFAYSALICGLITVSFIDMATGEIPDEITLGGMAAGLILSFAFPGIMETASRGAALKDSALGILSGGGAIFAMGVFGKVLFRKEAMGGGDVKLTAMIGSFLGWKLALLTFFIAPFFGAAMGIIAKTRRGAETIPYGPYLSLGAVVSIFYGKDIIRLIFGGL